MGEHVHLKKRPHFIRLFEPPTYVAELTIVYMKVVVLTKLIINDD